MTEPVMMYLILKCGSYFPICVAGVQGAMDFWDDIRNKHLFLAGEDYEGELTGETAKWLVVDGKKGENIGVIPIDQILGYHVDTESAARKEKEEKAVEAQEKAVKAHMEVVEVLKKFKDDGNEWKDRE